MKTVAVIGCGAWASTVTCLLAEKNSPLLNNTKIKIWCHDKQLSEHITQFHTHPQFDQIKFDHAIEATHDLDELIAESSYIILGVASPFLSILEQIKKTYSNQPILILTKGVVENGPSIFVSENVKHYLGNIPFATLSGPNLAAEIQDKKPATTVISSPSLKVAKDFQNLLSCPRFRVYTSMDQKGVEIGGVLKNSIAVACGISEGLNLGNNCRSSLITRGLQEIIRFGTLYGGEEETFYGLSGMGDLITTCSSSSSRNYRLGVSIAEGKTIAEAISHLSPQVAEGYKTTKIIYEISKTKSIDMPILSELHKILYHNKPPMDALMSLMSRPLKSE